MHAASTSDPQKQAPTGNGRVRRETPDAIRLALDAVAERFGGAARDTILMENAGKHAHEVELILSALPENGRVLDIGGGLGVDLLTLKTLRGARVEATLVDRFVEYTADNRMGDARHGTDLLREGGINLLNLDFYPTADLPLDPASFDVITCFDVVEHLPGHPLSVLREAHRLLRPGGTFFLSGPNATSLMRRIDLLLGRHPYIPFDAWVGDVYYSHVREYTRAEYERLLRMAGFTRVRSEMVAEPAHTRARNRYHHVRHGALSPTTAALWGLYLVKRLVPSLRPSVYLAAQV